MFLEAVSLQCAFIHIPGHYVFSNLFNINLYLVVFLHVSMMRLDGHQKNIILKRNNPQVDRMSQIRKGVQGCNLALSGMRHPVIIMMLPRGSTMMEPQVLLFSLADDGNGRCPQVI